MKKWLIFTFFALTMVGCKTTSTEYVYRTDTLTIERAVEVENIKHDTLTVNNNIERIEERIVLDTLERVREVVKVKWRDRSVKEQGSKEVQVVHDTIVVKEMSAVTEERKETTPRGLPWWLYVMLPVSVGIVIGLVYLANR